MFLLKKSDALFSTKVYWPFGKNSLVLDHLIGSLEI